MRGRTRQALGAFLFRVERLALQKDSEVGVAIQHRVGHNFLQTPLQGDPTRLDKLFLEPAERMLFRDGRHNDARVAGCELVVKP